MSQTRHRMPTHCPVTGEPLEVTRLHCPESGIVIEGRFKPNEFALLPPENLEFLRLFVRARGNLKEVERILGVSYPTVRQRFESMLAVLGYEAVAEPATGLAEKRSEILERLERGELDAEDAARALQSLRNR